MLLLAQFASHPMLKMSTIHQHTSFKPSSRLRRSLRSSESAISALHACAMDVPLLKQLRDNVIQSKRFSSFTRELYHNLPLSIAYNSVKILINALSSPAKIISEAFFYETARVYKKIVG